MVSASSGTTDLLLGAARAALARDREGFETAARGFRTRHLRLVDELVADAAGAKALHAPDADWTPESVGFFIQAVLQGSFIFAKAKNGAEVARDNLAHLRRYLESLFPPAVTEE